jgi:hypothetical protein
MSEKKAITYVVGWAFLVLGSWKLVELVVMLVKATFRG